jgi:hypothetical protein
MVKKSGRAEGDPAGFLTWVIGRVEWLDMGIGTGWGGRDGHGKGDVWSKNPAGPKVTRPNS